MRQIALTMLVVLWPLTCRTGEQISPAWIPVYSTTQTSNVAPVAPSSSINNLISGGNVTIVGVSDPHSTNQFTVESAANSVAPATYAPLVMGGTVYPCTMSGLQSSLSDAVTQYRSTVDARACESLSLTRPITIGSATRSVSLLIPSSGVWLLSGISDGASCFITVLSGSSIIGQGSHNGGNKFSLINKNSSVNADSMICTDPIITGYVRIEGGLLLENLTGGTYVSGLLHAQNLYDASSFRDITVANPGGIGVYVQGVCCGATFEKLQIDGQNATGSRPLIMDRGPVGGPRAVSFINLSADHAGNGQSEITLMGGPYTNGVNFYNTYVEANPEGSGTPHIEILSAQGGVNFFGVQVGIENLSDTAACIDIAADAGNAVNIYGLDCTQPGRIAIADHVLGQTIYSQIGGATPPYSNFINSTTFANLGTPSNGVPPIYCADCTIANPCAEGGTGAFAKRLNGIWVCN